MSVFLYSVTRRETGDQYIGLSKHPQKRWRQHQKDARAGKGFRLHNALRAYGKEAFDFRVCAQLPTHQEAKIAERLMIAIEKPCYNLTAGGDGTLGLSRPDVAARMRQLKGLPLSAAHRERLKISRNERGTQRCSEQTRAKIGLANAGRSPSPEARAKMRQAKLGNKNAAGVVRSPETRAKISATKRARAAAQKLAGESK